MWRRSDVGPLLALLATLGGYLATLLPRLIVWDEAGNLWVGHEHLWSDWPFHIAMARRFGDCPPAQWLAHHPMIGGEPLRYPFVAALLSGLCLRAGLGIRSALLLPSALCVALLLPGMYLLWRQALGGRWRAVAAVALFFLSAGPGALTWAADVRSQGIEAVLSPPREYGRVDEYGWYAGNFLVGMLLPQRAFLPGMTVAVWALALLLAALQGEVHRRRDRLLLAALLTGVLPIVHVHSFLATAILGGAIALGWARGDRGRWRTLIPAIVIVGTMAACLYILILRPVRPYPNFVSWRPGFVVDTPGAWLTLWWRLWGVAVPAAALASFVPGGGAGRWLLGGAGALFGVGNLVLFQPIAWDNSKVFLWAYFAATGAWAHLLAHLWRRRTWRVGAIALGVALTATGTIELIALQRTDRHRALLLDREDIALGEAIRRRTLPGDIFLTAPDIGNAPMTWGARPIFLGFPGWMPNFGFRHDERERELRTMLSGGAGAEDLLRERRIRYALIGPGERDSWGASEAWYAARFGVFYRGPNRRVYDLWVRRAF